MSQGHMQESGASEVKAVIVPADHALTLPPESFDDATKGELTWHTLISAPETPTRDISAGITVLPPSTGHLCEHRHAQAEIYHVLEGTGEVTVDGQIYQVSQGSTVFIPPNAEHGVKNIGTGSLKIFYVFPTSSFSDVVYRFSKDEDDKPFET